MFMTISNIEILNQNFLNNLLDSIGVFNEWNLYIP